MPPARGRDWRFADGVIDAGRQRWIGVREDHTVDGEPVNTIVAVGLDAPRAGEAAGRILAGGHDFYSSPRLSPDGSRLTWLAWDHPNMPWNGTMLYLAEFRDDGGLGEPQLIAGGAAESIFQPEWSPDGGAIVFVSDRSGWWNLYRCELATRTTRPLAPMAAEFGLPQWVFGLSTYAFAGPDRIVCAYSEGGLGRLAVLDLTSETLSPLDLPFTEFGSVRADGDRVVLRAGAPNHPASIVTLDLATGRHSVLKKATDLLDRAEPRIADYLTRVESVEFPTTGGNTAFGLFYPPANPDYAPPAEERPPLLVKCPRRADLGGIEHAQSGHSILDQPRHRGAGRELRRLDRLRPRLPRPSAADLGRGRRRRLRQRRQVPGRAGTRRRQALRDQRRQRRRLYHAGGADLPRLLPGRRRATTASATPPRSRATPTSSSRAISTG